MVTTNEATRAIDEVSGRKDWAAIQQDYLQGGDGLRGLAAKHGVSFHTVAKRAKREGWAAQRRRIGDTVATSMATTAAEVATERGRRIGYSAAHLIERQIRGTHLLLSQVERNADPSRELSPRDLSQVASAFRNTVETGRSAYPELLSGLKCGMMVA